MKYLKYLLLLLIIIPIPIKAKEIDPDFPDLYSENAILYNMTTDEVLYEENPDKQVAIASLTKIMTTIIAIENIDDIQKTVTIPEQGLAGLKEANASVAGFKLNDKVTYEDLLYGALLPSGGDATQTLAYYIAGSNENFVKLMNEKASELNLKNTHFSDPTGLDDHNNYSTVRDVSTILKYALENETFKEIFTTQEYTTSNNLNLKSTLYYNTHNYNLNNLYIYGSKTGFTDIAGFCLATIAKNDDTEFLLVTTGAPYETRYPYHFVDAINIYNYYTDNYHYLNLLDTNDNIISLDTKYSKEDKYNYKPNETTSIYVKNNITKENLTYNYEGIKTVTPFTKQEQIGTLTITLDNETLKTVPIIYNGTLTLSLLSLIMDNLIYLIGAIILITIIIILIIKKKKNKKKRKKRKYSKR